MPRLPLELSDELDLDLRAFCEVFYDANRSAVARRALVAYIEREVDATDRRQQFQAARRRLGGDPLRLVSDADVESQTSDSAKR